MGAYISIPRVTLSPSVTEWKKEQDLTTELEPSKERSEALEVFRKIPEVSKWIELTVKGGRFEVDATGKATWS